MRSIGESAGRVRWCSTLVEVVGDTGLEPVTSCMSSISGLALWR